MGFIYSTEISIPLDQIISLLLISTLTFLFIDTQLPPQYSPRANKADPLQQASLSKNAQWRSQKPFKPCAEY
jgi:hypothetical protein